MIPLSNTSFADNSFASTPLSVTGVVSNAQYAPYLLDQFFTKSKVLNHENNSTMFYLIRCRAKIYLKNTNSILDLWQICRRSKAQYKHS